MQDRYIQMLTVAPFIMIVCMAIEICILFVEYKMLQSLKTKRSCKYQVVGKKLSYGEIPGRPTRYKIVVEYEVNGTSRKTIHTADSGARRLEKEEKVFLRCSNNSDKVFWAEESDNSRIAAILILGIIAIVLLTIIVFAISGKLMQAY